MTAFWSFQGHFVRDIRLDFTRSSRVYLPLAKTSIGEHSLEEFGEALVLKLFLGTVKGAELDEYPPPRRV
jgi:hypothetical protein